MDVRLCCFGIRVILTIGTIIERWINSCDSSQNMVYTMLVKY